MALFKKRKLSGSTNGKGILVGTTGSPGTLIHTAITGTTAGTFDEIWLYAVNTSGVDVELTIQWGETTAPDGNIELTVANESGLVMIVPGFVLQNGAIVRAFAGTTDVIVVHGFVNTITD
jgi:hypothetical protein